MAQKCYRVRNCMADKETLEVCFAIDSDEDRNVVAEVDNTEGRTSEDEVPPQVCKTTTNKRHLHTKRAAYWPPSEVTKHVKEGTLPDMCTWTLHDVRILGSKDEYLVARRAVDNSQHTSNLDKTDDDSKRGGKELKRKRNNLGLESSEEEDYCRSQSVHPAAPLPDPLQPKVENNCLYPQASALTTRILAPRHEHPNDHVDSLQGVQEKTNLTTAAVEGSIQEVSNEALLRHILKQGIELKLMLQEAKDMLIHLTTLMTKDQPAPSRDGRLLPEDLFLPVRTQQELLDLEGRLDDDSFHELLIKSLSCVGGMNAKDCVKRIMRRILTDKVARNYNWKGQKGEKCAFKGLKVQTMICKAVRKNSGCMETSDNIIEGAIKEWLRFAAERDGGRKEREEKKKLNARIFHGGDTCVSVNFLEF